MCPVLSLPLKRAEGKFGSCRGGNGGSVLTRRCPPQRTERPPSLSPLRRALHPSVNPHPGMVPPTSFPLLPPPAHSSAWPGDVQTAYTSIRNFYTHALELLSLDNTDPLRLRFHLSRIYDEAIPLLIALEDDRGTSFQPVPVEWLEEAANALGLLAVKLEQAVVGTELRCVYMCFNY